MGLHHLYRVFSIMLSAVAFAVWVDDWMAGIWMGAVLSSLACLDAGVSREL